MNGNDLREIKGLLDQVVLAHTKSEAAPLIGKLKQKCSSATSNIDPYLSGKLNEAVSFAEAAAGQVADKDHWMQQTNRSWFQFETKVRNDDGFKDET